MSGCLDVAIEGIGLFAPGLPNWTNGRDVLAGLCDYDAPTATRPAPNLLAANERRRAPETVLLALDVAEQACAMAQRNPRDLPNVFASAYGDLGINDYLCGILAQTPLDLSPTKFHNSVHNAPAGYWTIATACMATSTALSAGATTFAAGLLEACLLVSCESTPVVFAAFDIPASGPLADVIQSRTSFGSAFVLGPVAIAGQPRLRMALRDGVATELAPQRNELQALHAANPAAASLSLLTALARREPAVIQYDLAALAVAQTSAHAARIHHTHLHLEISF